VNISIVVIHFVKLSMLSEANEADYLRPPACCRCCAEKTTNCVCQACHDG